MTALLQLARETPMLFQGQAFASSAPFVFFADHKPDLAEIVRKGRREFLSQFPSLADPHAQAAIPDPHRRTTFEHFKLDPAEVDRHAWAVHLHRDLLRLRREDPTLRRQEPHGVDGAVLGPEALGLRFFGETSSQDRLLLLNLGCDLACAPMPEPLLAPPWGCQWVVRWSSEEPRYGGGGSPSLSLDTSWLLPGHAAFVLVPEALSP
jgi:maltooligosyltrehalose trehalohydrolase